MPEEPTQPSIPGDARPRGRSPEEAPPPPDAGHGATHTCDPSPQPAPAGGHAPPDRRISIEELGAQFPGYTVLEQLGEGGRNYRLVTAASSVLGTALLARVVIMVSIAVQSRRTERNLESA